MEKQWNPADLLQVSGGYWSACALHAGVKLDVFTPLAGGSLTAPELAGAVKADPRALAMLLTALAAMGLVERADDRFTASPFAAEYLARTSEQYLGHIILHHHHLMSGWTHLDEAVRNGGPLRERISHSDDEAARESFLMGMFNLAMQLAPRIVSQIDLTGRRRLLDLGGGPGTYAIHFCQKNPGMSAVVYDLPSTRKFAEQTITRFGLSDRIAFEAGDFVTDDPRGPFDVAWLSHVLHGEGPKECATILQKAVAALEPGGLIMVQEFILDDSLDGPVFPALFSLNMLLATPQGQAYSQAELSAMLESAGVTDIIRLPIELPNGAGVIAGIVPEKH